jgi:hypothetical protein
MFAQQVRTLGPWAARVYNLRFPHADLGADAAELRQRLATLPCQRVLHAAVTFSGMARHAVALIRVHGGQPTYGMLHQRIAHASNALDTTLSASRLASCERSSSKLKDVAG